MKDGISNVSRRGFLGSAGASLTLPWLASLPLRAEETGRVTRQEELGEAPVRFGCVFFSNGVEPTHWWAKGQGSDMQVGPGLEPLARHTQDMIFLRGLFNEQAVIHKSPHLGRSPNLLSGGWVSTRQDDIRCGQSMDQLMAQKIGGRTAVSSLVLGIEPTELRLEDGLSMLYGSNISWSTATKPATKEIYPSRVFDQLVGDGKGREIDRSILDEVYSDAKALRPQLSADDRNKLQEYLDSVRSIERRIDQASKQQTLEGWRPSLDKPNMPRPAEKLPQDVPVHMQLMLDLIVLAFQMDKTRIATCMLNNDLSQMNFGFLDGVRGSLHLDLTHNGEDEELEAMYLKTNQYHSQQFAYILERMKGIDEGERTLLDNSLLLFCSNLFDGDKHEADHMPMVLAGTGGGKIDSGRVLDCLDRESEDRRACNLYLSIMDHMGVDVPHFGDASGRLAGL